MPANEKIGKHGSDWSLVGAERNKLERNKFASATAVPLKERGGQEREDGDGELSFLQTSISDSALVTCSQNAALNFCRWAASSRQRCNTTHHDRLQFSASRDEVVHLHAHPEMKRTPRLLWLRVKSFSVFKNGLDCA